VASQLVGLDSKNYTWLTDVFSGVLVSVLTISFGLSYAVLIFAGPLVAFLPYGIAATFISTTIIAGTISIGSSFRFAGLAESNVGFETNFISAADWETLHTRLPKMQMTNSTEMMDVVRAVKTPSELAYLKRGADMLDDAFLACFPLVRPGMRERDLHAALVGYCLSHGSEFTHGILNSERNTIQYAGESDFAFAAGDAIRTDYVAYMQGYAGHQSRCAVVGKPSAEQTRQYTVIRDIYRAANDRLLPGKTAAEIYQFVVEKFEAAGMAYKSMLAGHSVGAWWHQQEPVIARGNPRVLEEGMVIAMEPHVNHWHIQDMFVIRADGPELISDKFSTDEIFACGL
jgi:Xaa-Pro aminopeptidase